MDLSTRKYLNEEVTTQTHDQKHDLERKAGGSRVSPCKQIYFMCSTEVCLPSGSPCTETCFDGKVSVQNLYTLIHSNVVDLLQ